MDHFELRDGVMHTEDIPLPRIAEEIGTPVYVYSRATLERHAQVFRDALKDVPRRHIAFAIKCNPNLGVLRVLARSEEHTSELQSLMRISSAVFCLKKKKVTHHTSHN